LALTLRPSASEIATNPSALMADALSHETILPQVVQWLLRKPDQGPLRAGKPAKDARPQRFGCEPLGSISFGAPGEVSASLRHFVTAHSLLMQSKQVILAWIVYDLGMDIRLSHRIRDTPTSRPRRATLASCT
jgi:hypothetical protein